MQNDEKSRWGAGKAISTIFPELQIWSCDSSARNKIHAKFKHSMEKKSMKGLLHE
jgi:hypothetical protein